MLLLATYDINKLPTEHKAFLSEDRWTLLTKEFFKEAYRLYGISEEP